MRTMSMPILAALITLGTATAHARPVETPHQIHNIWGFFPNLDFRLQAAGGKTVTQNALKGKVVLLYFGYANCPDVCPTTMAELGQVITLLGPEGADARIVFVSVDPARDTPSKLKTYVHAFSKNAIGLTASPGVIADLARRYRVAYQIKPPATADKNDYVVTHSRGIYIFDQQGRARLLASDAAQIKVLANDVRQIIEHPDKR